MKFQTPLPILGALVGLTVLADAQTTSKSPTIWLASDVIDMKVVDPKGEKLGKVEDVVVHPGGETAYAVLSFGGTLGMGDKLFAMPWSVLRTTEAETSKKDSDRSIVLPLDKERLKNAPGFDKAHWPVLASADWAKDIDAYYLTEAGGNVKRPVEAGARTSVITWKCSDLKGADVKTPTGEKLGDIEEIAIDTNGRVNYVAVSVGGFLGMGESHVAVPWDALKFSLEGEKGDTKVITLATTKQQLEKAPRFKPGKDKVAEMTDPKWIGGVYDYYSVQPYWPRSQAKQDQGR
ncbi:MAG: PRC-barrel domain-containing protein [Planctomycetes bacterium]|nr:PRC-barrel domain-containing protein [Planctomycetota bacterium]